MSSERPQSADLSAAAKAIFLDACELSTAQRVSLIDERCAGETSLRTAVQSLLDANDRAGEFLQQPVVNRGDLAAVVGGALGGAAAAADRASPVKPESLPRMIGRYKLLEMIGEGGFGAVYMAEQLDPVRRRVALKVIKLGMDTRQVIAVFNQSGGTHSALIVSLGAWTAATNQADTGAYNLSGGNLTATYVRVAYWPGAASFTQTGGSHQVSDLIIGSLGIGTYNLSGTDSSLAAGTESIGYNPGASGVLNQTGGTHTVSTLYLGYASNSAGTVILSGGLLVGPSEYVGFQGTGSFWQSGGTHLAAALYLGEVAGSSGRYAMTNGTLTVLADAYIGYLGTAAFQQSGGAASIAGTFSIGQIAGGNGTANLSGGTFAAAATINNGTFKQTGGSSNLGPISGIGSISLGGGSALAQMTARSFSQSSISIANNGALSLVMGAQRFTNTATALSITGIGKLDLANHALLTNTDPTTIKSYLALAYSPDQDWSGPAGLTSSVASSNPTKYSLAYASGSDPSAQDAGIPVAPGQTLVQAVLTGDANLDGTVDFFDITQLLGYKYNSAQPASYTDGDLNYDGVVDFFDIATLLSANYNTGQTYLGGAAASPAALRAETSLPEPLAPALIGVTLAALLRRRHRRP